MFGSIEKNLYLCLRKSVKNKYIDNIRPPMVAVSVASSAPSLLTAGRGGLGARSPTLSEVVECAAKGVWG